MRYEWKKIVFILRCSKLGSNWGVIYIFWINIGGMLLEQERVENCLHSGKPNLFSFCMSCWSGYASWFGRREVWYRSSCRTTLDNLLRRPLILFCLCIWSDWIIWPDLMKGSPVPRRSWLCGSKLRNFIHIHRKWHGNCSSCRIRLHDSGVGQ